MMVVLVAIMAAAIGLSLGTVGAGGSILAVPVLVYVVGQSPKVATSSSLVIVCATSLMALRPHWTGHRVRNRYRSALRSDRHRRFAGWQGAEQWGRPRRG